MIRTNPLGTRKEGSVEQETRDVKNRGKFRNEKPNELKRRAKRNGEGGKGSNQWDSLSSGERGWKILRGDPSMHSWSRPIHHQQ